MPMTHAFRAPRGFAPALSHHIFLIAIRDEPEEPIVHHGDPLHPMQAILTAAGEMPPFGPHEVAIGPLPPLPQPRRLMQAARTHTLMPREVTGEILRDSRGRLYERLGDSVRPVNRLFTGTRGEMIDLAPIVDTSGEDDIHDADDGGQEFATATEPAQDEPARAEEREPSLREVARRLVPEPGAWRLVRYADFVDALSPQLANPRRLQPAHQLPCYAQIHETAAPVSLAALEKAAERELGHAGKLLPLSYDLCRRLAISLPRPPLGIAARAPKVPGMVPPGARFLALRVALDPTADAPRATPAQAAAAAPQAMPNAAPPAAPQARDIPEEFAKPWELRMSRDEALYDMSLAASRGALRRFLDRLGHGVSSKAMAKWHALLRGKGAEEQLWGIRPPDGALEDSRVRRWVDHTLHAAGYDVDRMRVEWEIHWRRKGL